MVPSADRHEELADHRTSCESGSRASCAAHELITIIGDRWSVLVVIELGDHGETRSADLKRSVDGISQKMLTSCLRRLEGRGLVARTVTATVPVSVSYRLTRLGQSFFEAFGTLRRWADDHVDQLDRPVRAS